jgi:RND superfamily putative drug exporter
MHTTSSPSVLRRLGSWCYRRHWRVVLVWVVGIFVLGGVAGAAGDGYSDSFGDFDSEATRGFDLLEQGFGGNTGENPGTIVFLADGAIDDPEVRPAIETYLAEVDALDDIQVTGSPFEPGGESQIASQGALAGRLAYANIEFPPDTNWTELVAMGEDVTAALPAGEPGDQGDGLRIEFTGQPFIEQAPPDSEALGVGFAIVILILAFGSVLAMGLPIVTAVAGIMVGVITVGVVSNLIAMPEFTSIIAIMIGLGVGIDYALFIVTRYREDLHKGMPGERAAGHALDTAGRAVIFAGITVVISLLGMMAMGLDFIRGIGVGSAIPVLFVMVASITLLPAFLGLAGDRLEVTRRRGLIAAGLVALSLVAVGLGVGAGAIGIVLAVVVILAGFFVPWLRTPLPPRHEKPPRETFWYRYSRLVQRHAWAGALGGLAILVVLALPVLGIRLGFSDEGNLAEDTTNRQAYDLLADGFTPGFNGPLFLVAEVPEGTDQQALGAITAAVEGAEGVAFVQGPQPSEDGSVVRWLVMPETGPQHEDTEALVVDLRDDLLDQAQAGTGLDVLVSGTTALNVDFSDYLGDRYPLFFGAILGLSFLLLMVVFRSLLVPLKAVIVNMLSIGAAYGIVVALFQWGWGSAIFNVTSGAPIEPFIPMMLFAIVFGLSMDYEVFLLSRMKEEYDRTGNNANAVADGLAVTARVITAAALIMVMVFGSFLLEDDRVVKLMGVGLAVAVALDATIVRMLLVPSTMELLGDRNWWLPKWLDRILPVVHVEAAPDEADRGGVLGEQPDEGERELVGAGRD